MRFATMAYTVIYRALKGKLLIAQTRVLKEIAIMDESENSKKIYFF
jgi:hypothetical protein